jgi:signal transduction histidine kinase
LNSVDDSRAGATVAGRGEIAISLARVGDAVEIAIADRGPGVAPQDRERALQRFVRLEKSRSRPGSGLGLSLVAAVARLHGGTVRLEDNAPGLKALLLLPLRAAPAKEPASAIPEIRQPRVAASSTAAD